MTILTNKESGMGMSLPSIFFIAAQAAIHLPPHPQLQGREMSKRATCLSSTRLRGDDGFEFGEIL